MKRCYHLIDGFLIRKHILYLCLNGQRGRRRSLGLGSRHLEGSGDSGVHKRKREGQREEGKREGIEERECG